MICRKGTKEWLEELVAYCEAMEEEIIPQEDIYLKDVHRHLLHAIHIKFRQHPRYIIKQNSVAANNIKILGRKIFT